jgi:hypothetical protein
MSAEAASPPAARNSATAETLRGAPFWAGALVMSLAAVWLHITFLTHAGGLWRDEVNLVNLSGLNSLAGLRKDSFPIVMPLLVRAWSAVGLGRTDFGLRCLGVLAGLGLLGAYWGAAWTTRRVPPLVSLAFMGLNVTALTYGDSLRAYGLGSLLIVLVMAAAWRFLEKPSMCRFACLTILAVVSVQTLFHNAVLVAAICAGAWAVCLRRKAWREAGLILAAGAIAAVSLLPYVTTVVSALDPSAGWRTGFRASFTLLDLRVAVGFPLEQYTYLWALFVLVAVVGGVISVLRSTTRPPDGVSKVEPNDAPLFAAVTLVVALAGFASFLCFAGLETQPWYFLPGMALVAACFDAALPRLPRLMGAVLLGLALVSALIAVPLARVGALSRFTNMDIAARLLVTEAAPEDFVIVSPWWYGISFDRYFKGSAAWSTLPPLDEHRFHRFDLVAAQTMRKHALQPVLDRIATTLQTGHRVWLLGWADVPAPGRPLPEELPPPPLKGWGWSETPYVLNWSDQAQAFLGAHSRQFEMVKIPTSGDVNPNENAKLARAKGWKE